MSNHRLVMSESQLNTAILDLAKAIISAHPVLDHLVFIGILTRGYPLAQRLAHYIFELSGHQLLVGKLDVSLYRDDLLDRSIFVTVNQTDIVFDIRNKTVILVDDVIFSGRTIRAALAGIADFGSPDAIEVAVLIDRGFRKLPVFANYVAHSIDVNDAYHVQVKLFEIDGSDEIMLIAD